MSSIITQTCNGYTVTLQIDVLSVRPASDPVETVSPAASPVISNETATMSVMPPFLPGEKGGEKESEKKVAQRKEKEKDPERESLASQLNRIAEAWNLLPLKKVARFTGRRKERTELLLAQYTEEEIIRTIYSIARSPFLLGGGANHWQIRFDWFILPDNFRKVLEGNYLDDEDEAGVDHEPVANGRLGFESRDLEAINQVWTDSSDGLRGGAV